MVELRGDLRLALNRVSFARALGIEPDPWQSELLRSSSDRVLLNCSRQSGKSTTSALLALHRALYHPGSLILCLAPALRQSQELFSKLAGFYRDLGRPVPPSRSAGSAWSSRMARGWSRCRARRRPSAATAGPPS
jgi:hypothetical protein